MLFGIICPVVLGLLAHVTVSVVGAGGNNDPFKKAEGFLRKLPKGCDKDACKIEFYMSKLQQKLKAEDKSHMFRKKNKELISLLSDLLALERAVTLGQCRPELWKQLKVMEQAVSKKQLDKLKYIVNHFGARYREQCFNTKITLYTDEYIRLERRLKVTLEPFLNRIIYARVCGYSPLTGEVKECNLDSSKALLKLLRDIDSFMQSDEPVLTDELMLMIEGLPHENYLREALLTKRISHPSMRGEFEHLLQENVVKNCNEFLKHMEPIYSDVSDGLNLFDMDTEEDEKGSRYFLGIAHYRLCKQAVGHSDQLMRIVFGSEGGSEEEAIAKGFR